MTRKLCLLLVCALAPIALITGCGGGGSSSTTSKNGGVSSSTVDAAKRNAASAYRNCENAAGNSGLTTTERATLQTECAAIRTGDAATLKSAGKQLCEQEAAALPTADRATMLASCKASAK